MSNTRSAEVHLGPAPAEGTCRGVALPGRWLLLARQGGVVHCIDDWCNHAGCLLSEGAYEDGVVTCPCHDARFSVVDGRLVGDTRVCEDQNAYEVVERDGQVYWRRET